MAYYIVTVDVNIKGDILVTVEVPLKFIVPSTKYIYDLKRRKIVKELAKEFFIKQENERVKKHAELEYKTKFGSDIMIKSLKLIDYNIENENLIIKYKANIIHKRKDSRNKLEEVL